MRDAPFVESPKTQGGGQTRGSAMTPSEMSIAPEQSQQAAAPHASTTHYDVTALPVTIWFNRDGDHDHNGLMFALTKNVPILNYIEAMGKADRPGGSYPPPPSAALIAQANLVGVALPATPAQ